MAAEPVRVLIIGAGRLGRAFEHLIRQAQRAQVEAWDENENITPAVLPLHSLARSAAVTLVTVPTPSIRTVVHEIGPHISPGSTVAFFSKGLEPATHLTAAEIAAKIFPPHQRWVVVGGPLMAEHLKSGSPGQAVVAGPGVTADGTLLDVLPHQAVEFERADDPYAVSILGVLKNIYAMVYGIGIGLNWPAESLATLWQRCEQEMVRSAKVCGVDQDTAKGLAGLADFRLTASSPFSRNRRAGERISAEHFFDYGAESVRSFPFLLERFPALKDLGCIRSLRSIFLQRMPAQTLAV